MVSLDYMRAFCHVLWAPVIWTHRLYERPSLVALATSQFAVRPNGLGFRILRGGNSSEDNHHEAVDIVLSAITETVRTIDRAVSVHGVQGHADQSLSQHTQQMTDDPEANEHRPWHHALFEFHTVDAFPTPHL